MAQARRLARENRQDEARTQLAHEKDYHERVERDLGARVWAGNATRAGHPASCSANRTTRPGHALA